VASKPHRSPNQTDPRLACRITTRSTEANIAYAQRHALPFASPLPLPYRQRYHPRSICDACQPCQIVNLAHHQAKQDAHLLLLDCLQPLDMDRPPVASAPECSLTLSPVTQYGESAPRRVSTAARSTGAANDENGHFSALSRIAR
jgi:hypothetical protein